MFKQITQWFNSPFTEEVSETVADDGTITERSELHDSAGAFVRYEGRKGENLQLTWERPDAGQVLAEALRNHRRGA